MMMKSAAFAFVFLAAAAEAGTCPAAVKKAVKTGYPHARILSCKKEKAQYEVKLSNKKELDISPSGSVLQTEEQVEPGSVPGAVTSGFEAKYPGTKAVRAEKQTRADGAVTYEIAFEKDGKKREATFSEDGKFKEEE